MASTAAAGQTPDVSSTSPPASPVTPTQTTRRRYEYYKEESFGDIDLTRTVHLGWGAMGGAVPAVAFSCPWVAMNSEYKAHIKSAGYLRDGATVILGLAGLHCDSTGH